MFAGYSWYKIISLFKKYEKLPIYEVILDDFSTSYFYRGAVYYKVNINCNGIIKKVDTNPYFSNSFMSVCCPSEYNNKKVVGLYDEKKDKLYVIKLLN